jgi:drug/metabolite transporter (DMT)-like permease
VQSLQWVFYAIAFGGVLLIERFDPRHFAVLSGDRDRVGVLLGHGVQPGAFDEGKGASADCGAAFPACGRRRGLCQLVFLLDDASGWDWFYLVLIGVLSQLGQQFLTNALQKERVAGVAIINYTG